MMSLFLCPFLLFVLFLQEKNMQEFIEIKYENICVQYWISKKGYCYRQYETEKRAKRISEREYMSAYEEYHNY